MPKRGLFFWTLSPFLLIFIVLMPLLMQKRDVAAILTVACLEFTCLLMLIGLYDPYRFAWAWRGVGAMVFVGYVCYIIGMALAQKWQIPAHRGESNLFNAIAGLIAIGIPGLWWAIFGRFPFVGSSDGEEELDEEDMGEFDQNGASQ